MHAQKILSLSGHLQTAVKAVAALAVGFRMFAYNQFPKAPNANYGAADIVDFALALLLFLICAACAASGLAVHLSQASEDRMDVFRPLLLGMTVFAVYAVVYPHIPRLG